MHWELGDMGIHAGLFVHLLPFSSQSLDSSFLREAVALALALSPAKTKQVSGKFS